MGRAWREGSTGSKRISQARMVRVYIQISGMMRIREKKKETTIMGLYRAFQWWGKRKDSETPRGKNAV